MVVYRFNTKLYEAVKEEPRIFYVPLKGMHEEQDTWMYDGCHLHYDGEIKLQSVMKMAAIGMTSKKIDAIPIH